MSLRVGVGQLGSGRFQEGELGHGGHVGLDDGAVGLVLSPQMALERAGSGRLRLGSARPDDSIS